jgi:hypothetical protein
MKRFARAGRYIATGRTYGTLFKNDKENEVWK